MNDYSNLILYEQKLDRKDQLPDGLRLFFVNIDSKPQFEILANSLAEAVGLLDKNLYLLKDNLLEKPMRLKT